MHSSFRIVGVLIAVAVGCAVSCKDDSEQGGSNGGSGGAGASSNAGTDSGADNGGSAGVAAGGGSAGSAAGEAGASGAGQAGSGSAGESGAAGGDNAAGQGGGGAAGQSGAGGGAGTGGEAGSGGGEDDCALQGHWRADGDAADALGEHPGTLLGGLGYVEGKVGQAFQFDGSDDWVSIPHDEQFNPVGSFSIEAWIKTSYSGGIGSIYANYDCGNVCPGHVSYPAHWIAVSSGKAMVGVRGATQPLQEIVGMATISDGNWHHIVGVRDVEQMELRLYVDGALDASAALDPLAAVPFESQDGEADPIQIGAKYHGETTDLMWLFPGGIDEIALYFKALDDADVAARFANPAEKCP
jgi:hypothetical protein